MPEIDPLTLRLIADVKQAQASITNLERTSDRSFSKLERDVLRVEAQMKRSSGAIGNSLKGLATTFATLFTGRELVNMVDGFTRLQNSLRVSGLEGQKLEAIQSRLLALSSKYGVGIEGLANLYGKAADAGRSFGASEEQILQLTEATSQALKISGTNAQQAQGALLGLTQALSSGTVRAEEWNQANEGGLRPLLQAAAASEKYGGDINKLRAAVLAGKVSSQEFFNSILAGSAQLEGQASKAALTLSGAYEAISSRLTVYIGESAKANGVTAAVAGAMQLLAENIETIIPALAIVATFMGTRMVVAAIAGSRAYAGFTAVLAGTATASGAATAGLGALTAALTGPAGVALAITAVGAGLIYMAGASDRAEVAIEDLKTSNNAASDELDRMIGRLKAAGVETDELAAAAARAKGPIDDLADAYRQALIEARKFNQGTTAGKVQEQSNIIRDSQTAQADLRRQIRDASYNRDSAMAGRLGPVPGSKDRVASLRAQLAEEIRKERLARVNIRVATVASQAGVKLDDKPAGSSSPAATTKPASGRTGRAGAGTDPLDAQFRNEQELRALQLEEIRAKEQAATAATERAKYAREALDLEATMRRKDIDEAERKGTLRAEEAIARRKIVDNLYGASDEITVQGRETAYQLAISRAEQEAIARQQVDAMRDELDALGAEAGITDVRTARVAIERRMLEIQQQIERNLLEEAIASGNVRDAAQARAALGRKQAAERTGFERSGNGPLGDYVEELRKAGLNLDDQFESIAVNGLRSMNDGLADAIANSKNLGDVFKNVANQIIADLIRVAIQQTIVNALQSAFGGGSGGGGSGGGFFGKILNIAGTAAKFVNKSSGARAGGGPVAAGNLYRINEAGMEYFQPANSGRIIPIGEMNQRLTRSSQESGGGTVRVIIEEGPNFMSTIRTEATGVSLEVTRAAYPSMVEGAAQETQRRMSRPRMPGAGR